MNEKVKTSLSIISMLISIGIGLPSLINQWQPWTNKLLSFHLSPTVYFALSILFLVFAYVLLPYNTKLHIWKFTEKRRRYIPFIMALNLMLVLGIIFLLFQAINKLNENSSTYYLDNFPSNLNDITVFLESEPPRKSLYVCTDYIGYGMYSTPEASSNYQKLLKRYTNSKDIETKILVFSESLISPEIATQMNKLEWENETQTARFENFQRKCYESSQLDNKSRKFFLEKIFKEEQKNRHNITLGSTNFQLLESSNPFNFFLWIKDEKEAIFSFHRNSSTEQSEETFYTNDPRYVTELVEIFNEYSTNYVVDNQNNSAFSSHLSPKDIP